MHSLLRMLLVATALLASGAVQAAVAAADDACCAGERGGDDGGAPCRDCPPGLACPCCAVRGAVQVGMPELRPAAAHGVSLALAVSEPAVGARGADIFHPPRA